MHREHKVEELRDLIRVASMLRQSASAALNEEEVSLFLRAAATLEERASGLAYGDPVTDPALHAPVNLTC